MPTRAVLFDFDGVLADTENVHIAAWQRTFHAMGWHEADESCARAAAIDDHAFVVDVLARRKINGGDTAGWVERKRELTIRLLRDRPRLQPGAAELVQALRELGLPLGVVTTTPRATVEIVLAASGLLDAFDVIVTGDDVGRPKPDPEPYRLAVERLGFDPDDVIALEDSDPGRLAAQAAGLRLVAVAGTRPAGDEAPWFATLRDQPAILAALGVGPLV